MMPCRRCGQRDRRTFARRASGFTPWRPHRRHRSGCPDGRLARRPAQPRPPRRGLLRAASRPPPSAAVRLPRAGPQFRRLALAAGAATGCMIFRGSGHHQAPQGWMCREGAAAARKAVTGSATSSSRDRRRPPPLRGNGGLGASACKVSKRRPASLNDGFGKGGLPTRLRSGRRRPRAAADTVHIDLAGACVDQRDGDTFWSETPAHVTVHGDRRRCCRRPCSRQDDESACDASGVTADGAWSATKAYRVCPAAADAVSRSAPATSPPKLSMSGAMPRMAGSASAACNCAAIPS